jgi:hypothetical protein
MTSGKSGTIQIERGSATITTITKQAKTGNLLVVIFHLLLPLFRLLHNTLEGRKKSQL